jgi:hypothetical protein
MFCWDAFVTQTGKVDQWSSCARVNSPSESATLYKVGAKKTGNDGNKWIIAENTNGVKRWKLYKKETPEKKTIKKVKENPYYPQIYIYIEFKYDNNDEQNVLVDYFTKITNKKYKFAWEYGSDYMMVNIYKFYDKKIITEIKKFLKTKKFVKSFNINHSYEDEDGEIQEDEI